MKITEIEATDGHTPVCMLPPFIRFNPERDSLGPKLNKRLELYCLVLHWPGPEADPKTPSCTRCFKKKLVFVRIRVFLYKRERFVKFIYDLTNYTCVMPY